MNKILKDLQKEEQKETHTSEIQLEDNPIFNCYTDNYLVHTLGEKTHITQFYLETEEEFIEFTKSILFVDKEETESPPRYQPPLSAKNS